MPDGESEEEIQGANASVKQNNLDVLEALFIKQLKSELCQQKETRRVLELI